MSTRPYRARSKSSLPTIARFESGDVFLTTRMGDILEGFLHGVVPRDVALGEFAGEGVTVERRHCRALAETQPALGIIATGEFDLHVTLPFARPERKRAQRRFVKFERDGHAEHDTSRPALSKRVAAVAECGASHEITRFKGLGEISAGEFKDFIGGAIRLDPVNLHHLYSSDVLLSFFMGTNTQERQEFIIENLRVEKDLVEV